MKAAPNRNFGKQLFRQRKNILLFEWTICVKYNGRYNFFDKVFATLETINISQATCQRVWNTEIFLQVKND